MALDFFRISQTGCNITVQVYLYAFSENTCFWTNTCISSLINYRTLKYTCGTKTLSLNGNFVPLSYIKLKKFKAYTLYVQVCLRFPSALVAAVVGRLLLGLHITCFRISYCKNVHLRSGLHPLSNET